MMVLYNITMTLINQYIWKTWKDTNISTSISQDVIQHNGIQVIIYCDNIAQFLRIAIVELDTPGFHFGSLQLDNLSRIKPAQYWHLSCCVAIVCGTIVLCCLPWFSDKNNCLIFLHSFNISEGKVHLFHVSPLCELGKFLVLWKHLVHRWLCSTRTFDVRIT